MRKLWLAMATSMVLAGVQASLAEEPQQPAVYADVRIVGLNEYFAAKQAQQPISEQDTVALIKQQGRALQLSLERWSVDNVPADRNEVTYYPTGDKLDAELNTWTSPYGSYTGKRKNSRGPGFYPNPVSSATQWDFDGVAVPFGWSPEAPGNFSYLYQLNDQGQGIHYILVLYGLQPAVGLDVNGDGAGDGALMTLTDGTADHQALDRPWFCGGIKVFDRCPLAIMGEAGA